MHLRYDRAFGVERAHTPIMLAELTSLFRSGLLQSATMSDGDRHSRTDVGLGGTKVIETDSPWLSMARHFLRIEDQAARSCFPIPPKGVLRKPRGSLDPPYRQSTALEMTETQPPRGATAVVEAALTSRAGLRYRS